MNDVLMKKMRILLQLGVWCCRRQLSPRPKSLMNWVIVCVDCQVRVLLDVFDLSIDGFITVLKLPSIIVEESEKLDMDEKKL